jgi:hypothetical protein
MTTETTPPITTKDKLWQVWSGLLDTFIDYLTTTPAEKRRAAMLAVIAGFLRDNGIRADGRAPSTLLEDSEQLKAMSLPFTQKH